MKKERLALDRKFSLTNFFKQRLGLLSKDDEYDHRIIENSLIKAFADYRDKEISEIKLSSDFNHKLMTKLIEEDIERPGIFETLSMVFLNRKSFKLTMVAFASFLVVGLAIQSFYINNDSSSQKINAEFSEIGKNKSNVMLNDDYAEKKKFDLFLSKLKSNPNHLRLLEELEEFYLFIGKKETATQIRYTLDSVSQ